VQNAFGGIFENGCRKGKKVLFTHKYCNCYRAVNVEMLSCEDDRLQGFLNSYRYQRAVAKHLVATNGCKRCCLVALWSISMCCIPCEEVTIL